MKKVNFLSELKEILEIEDESFSDNTPINLTSLGTLSVIVFVDENFNKQIKAADLKNVRSPKDLMTLIGKEDIEE